MTPANRRSAKVATQSFAGVQLRPASGVLAAALAGALVWWMAAMALSTRLYFLLAYTSIATTPPNLEPFAAETSLSLITLIAAASWFLSVVRRLRTVRPVDMKSRQREVLISSALLVIASSPWLFGVLLYWSRSTPIEETDFLLGPQVWIPLWFTCGTSFAVGYWLKRVAAESNCLQDTSANASRLSHRFAIIDKRFSSFAKYDWIWMVVFASLAGIWWTSESWTYFQTFRLGFNDFGHFLQRVANTAEGRGFLLETRALPIYWDHFNPGLVVLVPAWMVFQDVYFVFPLQAFTLSLCSVLVVCIARSLGCSRLESLLWGLAWLSHPLLGQINLSYSYGWHPITLALPFMFLAIWASIRGRTFVAIVASIAAASMEESVIVILALVSMSLGLSAFVACSPNLRRRYLSSGYLRPRCCEMVRLWRRTGRRHWAAYWAFTAISLLAFSMVFRWSGLAEFQTGRFHALGTSTWEVILSPIYRPTVFGALLLRPRNAIFLAGIFLPCFLPNAARGWTLAWPLVVPLGVLLMWDHMPAQSLAFHYPTLLLPVIWLSVIAGSLTQNKRSRVALASTALVSSLTASLFLGHFPWSSKTYSDIDGRTFPPMSPLRRGLGEEDQQYALEQLKSIRKQGGPVLATGRFAAHLVGVQDLETVGQFFERSERLREITRLESPLLQYDTILLDRSEAFQQTPLQTATVELKAKELGFAVVADRYEVVVLANPRIHAAISK